MRRYELTAVIWREGRRYVSNCPELGASSYGRNPASARAALAEAVELFLSNAKRLGMMKDYEPALSSSKRMSLPLTVAAR